MTERERPDKARHRRAVRQRRAARSAAESADVGRRLAAVLGSALPDLLPALPPAGPPSRAVGAYLSLPGEPPTETLREMLRAAGLCVLLPWLRDDRALEWVVDAGGEPPADPMHPGGEHVGAATVRTCGLLLVPALAVDTAGRRLGQGGGSYDRALADRPDATLVLAVVHDDEVVPAGSDPLPEEPHDVRVDGALTPSGLLRFRWTAPASRSGRVEGTQT